MKTLKHSQTKVLGGDQEDFSLPMLQVSPYFSIGRGAIENEQMKFFVSNLRPDQSDFDIYDGVNNVGNDFASLSVSEPASYDQMVAAAIPAMVTRAGVLGFTMTAADMIFPETTLPTAPTSYQTIVSQTGTSAPAVGSLTPVNGYTGTTFAWARTGAGVYTLTASTAVFNTSGKTGVFISQLNNLNANVKAVVTSTTVITFTTAVATVAVLGLLGLTVTNTDALLNNTMIYVQTYQ